MALPGAGPDDVVQFGAGGPARRRWVSSVLLACLIIAAIASLIASGVGHGAARPVAPTHLAPPFGVSRLLGPHGCPFSVTRDSTSTVGSPVVFHVACASLQPGTKKPSYPIGPG